MFFFFHGASTTAVVVVAMVWVVRVNALDMDNDGNAAGMFLCVHVCMRVCAFVPGVRCVINACVFFLYIRYVFYWSRRVT